jgi:putative transposase
LGGSRGRRIDVESREQSTELVTEAVANGCRLKSACEALGLSSRTVQRWVLETEVVGDKRRGPKTEPANKLTFEEKTKIISVVTSPEFRDDSPSKIVPRLADQGVYLASESTIYRILKTEDLSAYRSKSRPATQHRPEPYLATAPNQVWSWDISYLPTMITGIFFYLYLIVDIYSRKIVGFEVHDQEAAILSSRLIEATLEAEGIDGKELVLHSDNGAPMKGATMLATLQNLGVVPSFSRPSVSDDNPYSEALFKTAKYCPIYPTTPLPTVEAWREWADKFVSWYGEQPHSGIKFVTPNQRHRGEDVEILRRRNEVYEKAKRIKPERWSGQTRNWEPIKKVRLNPLREIQKADIRSAA